MHFVKSLTLLLSVFLSGCASGTFFIQEPLKIYDGPDRNNDEISLVRGQAYMEAIGYWVEVHVLQVDDKEVCRIPPGLKKLLIL